jgi:hypothetical protein
LILVNSGLGKLNIAKNIPPIWKKITKFSYAKLDGKSSHCLWQSELKTLIMN